ncbi:MAG: hypothetical protein ACMG6H_14940, partial [Acidobacteriota bacterium]
SKFLTPTEMQGDRSSHAMLRANIAAAGVSMAAGSKAKNIDKEAVAPVGGRPACAGRRRSLRRQAAPS